MWKSLAILSSLVIFILGFLTYRVIVQNLPDVSILKDHYPVISKVDPNRINNIILQKPKPNGWRSINEISNDAIQAVVISEDWAFWQHKGIDLNQIQIIIWESLKNKKLGRGASTITQQVVRNIFLTKEKKILRKLVEIYLSLKLEKILNKKQILEIYFNIAQWGNNLHGIAPASWYYLNKDASQLNAKEGAFLAMLLPSPRRYSYSFRQKKLTPFAKGVINSILDKLVITKHLSKEARLSLENQSLSFESEAL